MTASEPPPCRHERAQIADSIFHGDAYATPASRRIFCDVCRMQRWLDVEAALASSEAEMGLIPRAAAEEIARCAQVERIDLEEVRGGIARTGHSLVSLLGALEHVCEGGAGEFVHYGATTQDIQDTAQALEMRDVLDELDHLLRPMVALLGELARAHRDTLMIGRTHAQPALPTTFGLKVAGWVDELLRHGERLHQARPRMLVAQLGGGVGTMASFGGQGPQLLARFAARLGLADPALGWHVARDRVAEYLTLLGMLSATLARIADEVRTLSRPEFGELEEGWQYGRVGSSTMPHKRNPEACEQVVVLARLTRAQAGLGLESMIGDHERDSRSLRIEWAAVADASHHTLAGLAILAQTLRGLRVHRRRMAANAEREAEALCTERLMLRLGAHIGKQTAHELVYHASQQAHDQGRPLRAQVAATPDIHRHLSDGDVDGVFDPAAYLGAAPGLVDATVARAQHWLACTGGEGLPRQPNRVVPEMVDNHSVEVIMLPEALWRQIFDHGARKLRAEYRPDEEPPPKAYGLVGGRRLSATRLRVSHVFPLIRNLRYEPHLREEIDRLVQELAVASETPLDRRGWVADPLEVRAAERACDDSGSVLLGSYHMHRVPWPSDRWRDTPTALDTRLAEASGMWSLILSMVDPGRPRLRAFFEGHIDREAKVHVEGDEQVPVHPVAEAGVTRGRERW